jgi:uncharacterized protein YodC (DUF2158 family)
MTQYQIGDIVQIKSGGPILTVAAHAGDAVASNITAVYFNDVTGMFERVTARADCFKVAMSYPQVPEGAQRIRQTGLTNHNSLL